MSGRSQSREAGRSMMPEVFPGRKTVIRLAGYPGINYSQGSNDIFPKYRTVLSALNADIPFAGSSLPQAGQEIGTFFLVREDKGKDALGDIAGVWSGRKKSLSVTLEPFGVQVVRSRAKMFEPARVIENRVITMPEVKSAVVSYERGSNTYEEGA